MELNLFKACDDCPINTAPKEKRRALFALRIVTESENGKTDLINATDAMKQLIIEGLRKFISKALPQKDEHWELGLHCVQRATKNECTIPDALKPKGEPAPRPKPEST